MIRLPDGRDLEVEVSGPMDGGLLLFHQGTPDAYGQDGTMARAVHRRVLRLVTWSRSGYGPQSRAMAHVISA